ncbi:MAG TPA: pyridoxal-phosphate dependent enzyme, partial [Dermatophilaceae bacterium]|nr:pyridoxal-phosphate dependent enzyme [Dermatophilaceae bacterium]HOR15795.1 pyridoxal-phosphate dependent enzyme [Dermatophilaceae bacterium]HOV02545.1 pyridoxal-phosphate dependent enzyme [Dermatophilaceae bacterium]
MVLTTDDVLAARERTKGYLRRTPLLPPSRTEAGVWLKCEFLQHTGVFKARGAFNLLLAARERGVLDPQAGVVIASGGNAGLATAYAAGVLRVPATVFVPSIASAVKVARLRDYGADVHVVGTEYSHAASAAADFARVRGALASHAYDLPEVV